MSNKNLHPLPNKAIPFIWLFLKDYKYYYFYDLFLFLLRSLLVFFMGSYPYKIITQNAESGLLNLKNGCLYAVMYAIALSSYSLSLVLTKKISTKYRTGVNYGIVQKLFYDCLDHEMEYFNNRLSGDINSKITSVARRSVLLLSNFSHILIGTITILICLFYIAKIRILFSIIIIFWI